MSRNGHDLLGRGKMRARQQTLKSQINCSGAGLHSGAPASLTLFPAPANTGVVFRRSDLPGAPEVQAIWDNVVDTQLCTTLGDGNGVRIALVEHLMAALASCGVDNVVVELDGPEVPIMDGSSAPFVFLLECAGLVQQKAPLRRIEVLKHVSVGNHEKTAALVPGNSFSVSFSIEFDETLIKRQDYFLEVTPDAFHTEIARARTFGFDHEIATLRSMGLARGGSLDNAIVVSGDKVLNDTGLRYDDEFVRHKVLDSIGDLYLAGAPLVGHYHGFRSGHALTHELLQALFADETAWRYAVAEERPASAPDWVGETATATA